MAEVFLVIGLTLFVASQQITFSRHDRLLVLPLAVVFLVLLAGLASHNPGHRFGQSLSLVLYTVILPKLLSSTCSATRVVSLMKYYGMVCVVNALFLLSHLSFGDSVLARDTGVGRLESAIFGVGGGAILAAGAMAYYLARLDTSAGGWRYYAPIVILFGGILMDNSITALIVAASLVAMSVMRNWPKIGFPSKLLALSVLGGATLVVRYAVVQKYFGDDVLLSDIDITKIDPTRAEHYQIAIDGISTLSLLGGGLEDLRGTLTNEPIHNAYLQLAADVSPIAAILFIVFLGTLFVRFLRVLNQPPSSANRGLRFLAEAGAGFVLVVSVHRLFHPLGLVSTDWIFLVLAWGCYVSTYKVSPFKRNNTNVQPSVLYRRHDKEPYRAGL